MSEGQIAQAVIAARAIYEVTAGLLPGVLEERHTRRFAITSDEFEKGGLEAMLTCWHQAVAYATWMQLLCAHGREVNWVRIDFLWP